MREFDHVYFDVAYQSDPAMTEALVAAVGSGKVVFGSDCPFYDLGEVHRSVLAAGIPESAKDDVLGGNVQRILDARG